MANASRREELQFKVSIFNRLLNFTKVWWELIANHMGLFFLTVFLAMSGAHTYLLARRIVSMPALAGVFTFRKRTKE